MVKKIEDHSKGTLLQELLSKEWTSINGDNGSLEGMFKRTSFREWGAGLFSASG